MKIDYKQFEAALAAMKDGSKLFEVVRREMQKRNRWKNKPRGKAFTSANGGFDSVTLREGAQKRIDAKPPKKDIKLPKQPKPDPVDEEIMSEDDISGW